MPDLATEVTELLAQRTDWIWNINPDQRENINKVPYLQAVRQESMRVGYLSIDAAGRTGAGNPLTKLKVRQAIWHAVNRQEFADKLVRRRQPRAAGAVLPQPVRLRRQRRGEVRLRSGRPRSCWPRRAIPTASTSSS